MVADPHGMFWNIPKEVSAHVQLHNIAEILAINMLTVTQGKKAATSVFKRQLEKERLEREKEKQAYERRVA